MGIPRMVKSEDREWVSYSNGPLAQKKKAENQVASSFKLPKETYNEMKDPMDRIIQYKNHMRAMGTDNALKCRISSIKLLRLY
ncbi:hypothetical protein GOBAR_AA08869 [Gossypium barbadense]|uniref:Uncharacterized protein n=1 Tax=Gossypium barbadense TaxID=3634 RepID=A0A2P5Y878_GOSBA|nr:hypothetical protein GOBAR_AA08869 [Gossypium barbadense]